MAEYKHKEYVVALFYQAVFFLNCRFSVKILEMISPCVCAIEGEIQEERATQDRGRIKERRKRAPEFL